MKKNLAGSLLAIPSGDATFLAKIIFVSDHFKDVILLKLFPGVPAHSSSAEKNSESSDFQLYYTGRVTIRSKRWEVIGRTTVTDTELEMTRRTSGGEVWLEDQHLGPASETDLASLPKMLVFGSKLIEKYAGQRE